MTSEYKLRPFDPCPVPKIGVMDSAESGKSVMRLNINAKYLFVDDKGGIVHEYYVPSNPDIHNVGGYVGKVAMFRDPAMREHFEREGITRESFNSPKFPILRTRSPQIDLLVYQYILYMRAELKVERFSLFDHGCSVGEHHDLLDMMLRAGSGGTLNAESVLDYRGLDKSAILLAIAKMMHENVDPDHFELLLLEGTEFDERNTTDLSLSIGVVNHVHNPMKALEKILTMTRRATFLALWVTSEDEGFWAVNHVGNPSYFFSIKDLAGLANARPDGRFLVADFILESDSTQPNSYIGIGSDRIASMGSYHFIYTTLADPPYSDNQLAL